MKTLADQLKERKEVTIKMRNYLCSEGEKRKENRMIFENSVRDYQKKYSEAFTPYWERGNLK